LKRNISVQFGLFGPFRSTLVHLVNLALFGPIQPTLVHSV